jgi:AcrR family transcriptional regulator
LDVPAVKKMRPRRKKNPPPNERVARSKQAVLAATYKLLSEEGLAGVSVEAVSQRSGVAKTTIYRHWPSRSVLLLDACSRMGSKPQPPDTGSLKSDLETLTSQIAGRLPTAPWTKVLPSIIDSAERDPKLADLQKSIHAEMRGAFRSVIERAQQKGEISSAHDPSEIIAAILGPLFYRRWFSREPIDEKFVRGVVERAVRAAMEGR